MERKLLVLIIALFSTLTMWADVPINETNFPDENFRNWVLSQGYGADGVLTDAEIAEVKEIDVSSQNIQSLKGIEYFTALYDLFCDDNQLTSLDVSKNTELRDLWCNDNQLTSLDVSKNKALGWISCQENQLTSLDVSKNTALTSLGCMNNQLTSLDVSKNTELTILDCTHNQLTSLDVSGCTVLEALYCDNNQLTSLDVSKNTALKWLGCSQNQIEGAGMDALVESLPLVSDGQMCAFYYDNEGNMMTTVQVAAANAKGWTVYYDDGNDWVEYTGSGEEVEPDPEADVIAVNEENFPDEVFRNWVLSQNYGADGVLTEKEIAGVKGISVIYTDIESLKGIEYFTALNNLRCAGCLLTSLDVSKNTALTSLQCSFNPLTSLDVSGCTALETLYCYDNLLTSLDVSGYTALKTLFCHDNQLTSLDVSGCTALEWLECYNNQLTSLGVSGCTALGRLECYHNQIKGAEMDALVESLSTVSNGTMYAIYSEEEQNAMTTAQMEAANAKGWAVYYHDGNEWHKYLIEGEIEINAENFPDETFREWVLEQDYGADGGLTDDEIAGVTGIDVANYNSIQSLKGIEYFTALTSLNCLSNQLTSLDVSKNTALETLYCSGNQLTSLDVSGCAALKMLHCSDNQLTSLDVSNNTALKWFNCSDNQLTSLDVSGCTALEGLQCYNNQLTSLNVSGCTALGYLVCYHNQVKGAAMDALVESLPSVSFGQMEAIVIEDEQNVMTPAQVATARAKGWSVDNQICYINEENFPDENFRNWVLEQDDDQDGMLTEDEIAKAEFVYVSNRNIQSLKGIEFFTALNKLYCDGNQLTSLDVSKNMSLGTLYCYNNQIKDSAMDALVESLPTVSDGIMCAIYSENEVNVITAVQVAAANAKGWKVYFYDGNGWKEYADSSETPVDGDSDRTLVISFNAGGAQYGLYTMQDKDDVVYDGDNTPHYRTAISLDVTRDGNTTSYAVGDGLYKGEDYVHWATAINLQTNQIFIFTNSSLGWSYALDGYCYVSQLDNICFSKETVFTEANWGWHPYFTYDNGVLCLNHFSFAGYYAMLSTRNSDGTWSTDNGYSINPDEFIAQSEQVGNVLVIEANGSEQGVEGIAINETNFPDENFRNWVLGQSYGQDGVVTDDEIAGVTEIRVYGQNIQSLKGIEYFTALNKLYCDGNQLTSLDVSVNTALTTLTCYSNQLTSLDVSKNTALNKLYCDRNQLTSLDVSQNTALKELICYDNQLTEVDVSQNMALEYLDCRNIQLKSLDVSKNTKLNKLYCYRNQLTSLDVSQNTALTRLECYNNQLTSLDVSKNTVLEYLDCYNNQLTSLDVSKNTNLKYLYCNNNQLTELDVSNKTALATLNCNANLLTSLNVSGCTALKYLYCYENRIKNAEMDALVKSLAVSNGYMYAIHSENEQNVMTAAQVAAASAKGWVVCYHDGNYWQAYIVEIAIINEENFPDENFRNWVLSQSYGQDGVLMNDEIAGVTKIDVNSQNIQSLKGIEYFTALNDLNCDNNQLAELDVSKNTALESFHCDKNQLTSLDVSKNTALKQLACATNQLTSLDVSQNRGLAMLWCYNNQLTSLNVSGCSQLWILYCDQNQIKDAEMDALVEGLPRTPMGRMYVISNENEQNVMTTVQVGAAKAKGWTVYYYDGNNWQRYAGSEPCIEIEPISESIEMAFIIGEEIDLNSVIVNNTYITLDAENGDGYDALQQAVVLKSTTTEEQMSVVQDAKVGDDEVRDNYNGIIFEVSAGSGTISVDAQTIGTYVLNIQIGKNKPTKVTKAERGMVEVRYNVTEPTYVYLYASSAESSAARRSVAENSVLLYGYKVSLDDMVLGDATGDGVVDISDYIGVANHILGIPQTGFNADAADVNKDGVIDISDYIGVANIILTGKP